MGNYHISVVDSFEQWEALRMEWNDLLGKSASNNVFLTWEWQHSWAECFLGDKRELFILVVYSGNEIVGIAPWYRYQLGKGLFSARQIEFLGTPEAGSDYLDVFMKKGREKEVTRCLHDFLLGDAAARWDRLRLHDIPSNSLFLLHLLTSIKQSGKYVAVEETSFCPIAVLPGTEDEFFAGLSSRRGQRFRQDLRTLNKQDTVKLVTFSSDNLDAALKDFFVLYTEKAGWPGEDLYYLIGKFIEKRGTESIQIDFLATSGSYIGGLLHLRFQDTLYMYLMAIDKSYNAKVSVGNLLAGLCITNAIQSGISYYDFLKGIEDYKFHWSNNGRTSKSILFSQRKPIPVYLTLTDMAKDAAKLVLR